MEAHEHAVRRISRRVRHFYDCGKPYRVYHGSTNSTRKSEYRQDNIVDTSALVNVFDIDARKRTVVLEPNVPMDRLVDATLREGLVPKVVMEFPGITVGGGFSGTSGESSSFRYGFFERAISSIQIVIGNGEVMHASSEENADLFEAAASGFGTLGVVTLLELELIPAKPFVELTYLPVISPQHAVSALKKAMKDPRSDFVDGILFSNISGVICIGRLVDSVPENASTPTFSKASDPWFYLHAQAKTSENKDLPDHVRIKEYLFRYDRGAFWTGKYCFDFFFTPFNRVTRWILDSLMHTRVMYHALHVSGLGEMYIVQDVGVPMDTAPEFVKFLDATVKTYPLWLCPLAPGAKSPVAPRRPAKKEAPSEEVVTMLNFGVWGLGSRNRQTFIDINRAIEHKVRDLGGEKCLYAHAYYTKDEFEEIYDLEQYREARQKYHATHLPTIFDKVSVNLDGEQANRYWLPGLRHLIALYAVFHVFFAKDYLLRN